VSAKKEVILAAGSLHSPQLLQVSGIGDPELHSKIGVSTVVDLRAVGQNLHDHVLLAVVNSSTFSSPVSLAKHKTHHLHSSQRTLDVKPPHQQRDVRCGCESGVR
jgi:choline dehydrogenase-like flavoprotein